MQIPSMTSSDALALYQYLTPSEKREVDRLLMSSATAIWSPLPGPQSMAYASTADVIGYGGSAGGGKTDLALGKAINQHQRIAVYRVNGTEHAAFIDRAEELVGNRDGFNETKGIWRNFGPRKCQLELGSFPSLGEERKHRGRPHDLKVFDEASEMLEQQVRFLLTWLRTTKKEQRCQALLCFNPPTTAEGRWVISFFAPWLDPKHPNPAKPGEIRWFVMLDGVETEVVSGEPFKHGDELLQPQSRTFIPARVTDNPYLMGTNYMTQLQALPEPLRSQMLKGDFQAGMSDDPWQVIPTAWVDIAMARWKELIIKPPMDSTGVDVARGGKDKTIIARRHGLWFDRAIEFPGSETPDGPSVAGQVIAHNRDQSVVHIDVIGVGASPYDFLKDLTQTIPVNVSESATGFDKSGRLRFFNLRSQLWWKMREALDPQANNGIALPPDSKLKADLCAPTWRPQGPIIRVEGREEIVKRIGRSPDWASAYILALMDTPKINQFLSRVNSAPREHNPYDGV